MVDLSGLSVHDAGAGLLAGAGCGRGPAAGCRRRTARPADPGRPVPRPGRARPKPSWSGSCRPPSCSQPLLGLRGITSLAGRAAGLDPAELLATDAALERFAKLAAPEQAAAPGAGACGGLGFAVLALGGRLTTGPALAFSSPAGRRASPGVELVVTGCSVFDFARRGGGVVAAAAELAAGSLSPCVLIAGEVVVGAREMRAMGIEAAYAVRESTLGVPTGEVTEEELRRTAERVARSWHW